MISTTIRPRCEVAKGDGTVAGEVSFEQGDPIVRSLHRVVGMLVVIAMLTLAAREARASAMYTVTELTTLSGSKLNDMGQVVGTGYVGGYAPDAPTYALLYNSYGPNAGQTEVVGPANSQGLSINQSGQVVGVSFQNGSSAYYTYGAQTSLPGGQGSNANGINNAGQTVGADSGGPNSAGSGYGVYQVGNGTPLSIPPNNNLPSVPLAINNSGQVAGTTTYYQPPSTDPYQAPQTGSHAILWTQGQPNILGTLGGANSYGIALNDSGAVVGYSSTSSGQPHAFVFQNGAMRDLGTLGGEYSYAYGINNAGNVVGGSWIAGDTASHAFLYTDGKMLDLNTVAPLPPGLYLSARSTSIRRVRSWRSATPTGPTPV